MCNSIKNCNFCNQPVKPETQDLGFMVVVIYTCKNRDCRAGRLDITLAGAEFDALDVATLESYERGTGGTVRHVPTRQAVQS